MLVARDLFAAGDSRPFPIRQRDLQKFLMIDLLGLDCCFRFITRSTVSDPECVSWCDLLDSLRPLPSLPLYMGAALENARHLPPRAPFMPAHEAGVSKQWSEEE